MFPDCLYHLEQTKDNFQGLLEQPIEYLRTKENQLTQQG